MQLLLFAILFIANILSVCNGLYETDRVAEYNARGHQWPPRPEDYTPNTAGWRKIYERRFEQLENLKGDGKYDGYMLSVHAALNSKNFTENGWGLTRAPQHIIDILLDSLYEGLEEQKMNPRYEHATGVIDGQPWFITQFDINQEVLHDLLPLHEAWFGVPLTPNNAYGLRVYRSGSNLNMHIDKTDTHIVSSILHVDHDPNMESWPIIIEDFQGNTNEVHLESGDMLFYESSKCVHGRPKKMGDGWYSSLFIHYHPTDWDADKVKMDQHYRIPPTWANHSPRKLGGKERLEIVQSSLKEPDCVDEWCGLKNAVKYYGPAPGYGKVLTAGGVVKELEDIPSEESFEPDEEL